MKNTQTLILLLLLSTIKLFSQNDYIYPMGISEGVDTLYSEIPKKSALTRGFYENTPRSFSLKKYSPRPKSQGAYGTCTGWAVGYAARTILEAQKNNWTNKDTITKYAFSPTFQYRVTEPNNTNCNGAYTSVVVKSLQNIGSIPNNEFYVSDNEVMCPSNPMPYSNFDRANDFKIEEYTTLWISDYSNHIGKTNRVKKSISEGNPVIISMICPKSFHSVKYDGLWNPTESPNESTEGLKHGRHALTVIGYDDDKFGGAFEIQNSWGSRWGNEGYVWIKYNDFSGFVYQAFELIQLPIPLPKEPLLAGSLRLFDLENNIDLEVNLANKKRNWSVVGSKADYTYKVVEPLKSGSKMRMYLKSNKPSFVYMLGTGTVNKNINTLFPIDGYSSAMNYSSYEVALPSEDYYFEMDNTIGKDYIIILFSKDKLDIENIKKSISNQKGSISQKLEKSISNLLINSDQISFSTNNIEFNVEQNKSNKKTFAMIIEFEHVE